MQSQHLEFTWLKPLVGADCVDEYRQNLLQEPFFMNRLNRFSCLTVNIHAPEAVFCT